MRVAYMLYIYIYILECVPKCRTHQVYIFYFRADATLRTSIINKFDHLKFKLDSMSSRGCQSFEYGSRADIVCNIQL